MCGLAVETSDAQSTPTESAGEGNSQFIESGQTLGSGAKYAAALADVDNDGDLDAVLNEGIWLNDGTGQFTLGTRANLFAKSIELADIDGDSDLDILLATDAEDVNAIWMNMGGLQRGEIGVFDNDGNRLGHDSGAWDIATGDLDADGDLDAVLGNNGQNDVWLNDGSGIFSLRDERLGNAPTRGVAIADLDQDGDLDIFETGGEFCTVWLNDGWGNFEEMPIGHCVNDNVSLDLGDIDGDGLLEAYIGGGYGERDHIKQQDGGAIFYEHGQNLSENGTEGVALADIDSDGDRDSILANNYGPNEIWWNDGAGIFTSSGYSIGNGASYGVAVGDVDGDGDLDILFGNEDENKLWLNQLVEAAATVDDAAASDLAKTPLIFTDDFEDGLADFWREDQVELWRTVADDTQVLVGTGGLNIEETFTDFVFRTNFKFVAEYPYGTGSDYYVAFLFRGGKMCGDNHVAYELAILEHSATLNKTACDEEPSSFHIDFSPPLDTLWHQVQVQMVGNHLQVWLNNELVLDVIDEGEAISAGNFILGVHEYETVYFDEFLIEEITPDGTSQSLRKYTADFEAGFGEFWSSDSLQTWRIDDLGDNKVLRGSDMLHLDAVLADFEFNVDFQFAEKYPDLDGPEYQVAFVFRGQPCPERDQHSFYQLQLFEDSGTLNKNACTEEGSNFHIEYPQELQPEKWHQLRVKMVGSHSQVWINDQLVLDVNDTGEAVIEGNFTLGHHEKDTVYFDNFNFQEISANGNSQSLQKYTADFESGTGDFWNTDQRQNWQIEELDGNQALRGTGSLGIDESFADFEFKVDFYYAAPYPESNGGQYRVAFVFRSRSCDQGGGGEFYNLELFEDSGGLNKTACGAAEDISFHVDYPQILSPNEWHNLTVRMVGKQLQVWIDDYLVVDVIDEGAPLLDGTFILGQEEKGTVYFDDFNIQEISSDNQ